jgi:glycosyltransferase involved in cell wall biosynthesis
MNICIVNIHFPPEIGGAVHLVWELAHSLVASGHEVEVVTGFPSYNLKAIPKRYQKGWLLQEQYEGLRVTRLRVPRLPRGSRIARGFEHLIYGLCFGALALLHIRSDILLTYSPPLPLPWCLCWVGKLKRIPVVVSIQDLFPREAVELGMLSNRMIIRMFEMMERQMNATATRITVHSSGNKKHVIRQCGHRDRIDVVYNWVDTKKIQPLQKMNGFAHRHGLHDRFVVSYAGTMGWAQDMTTIIDSAALLKDDPRIVFLLVGDGVEKNKAVERGRRLGLKNLIWLPMQPWHVYPEVLGASNVSMINLHPSLRTPVVPSKLINIMAAGRPVIASLPSESDARFIIAAAGSGIVIDAGDAEGLAGAIRRLATHPELAERYGRRGRAFVESNFSQSICTRNMETVLRKAGGTAC